MLQQMNSERDDNPNQLPKGTEMQIHMMESMNRRLAKLYADIDQRYEGQIDNILSVHVENESATRKLAKKAMKNVCGNRGGRGNRDGKSSRGGRGSRGGSWRGAIDCYMDELHAVVTRTHGV